MAILLVVASCGRHEPAHDDAVVVERSALTSKGLSFFLPVGVQNGDVAVAASGTLKIDDRVKVQPVTGGAAILSQVATSPGGSSSIGIDAVISGLWSAGTPTLGDRVRVNGPVFANGNIVMGSGVQITGTIATEPGTVRQRPVAWSVLLPAMSASAVDVPTPTSKTIGPARYPSIYVHAQATLTVTAGTFFVDSLSLDAGAKILVDDSAGPVTIYVLSSLVDHGIVTGKQSPTPNLLLAYLGTADLVIDSPFSGALVAPSASLTFRPPQNGTTPSITGAIWGRDVEIGAGVIVEHHTSSALTAAIAGSGDAGSLTPIAEGRATVGTTTFAVFSYQNSSSQNVNIPYGPQNLLATSSGSIASPNPSPPTWLKPGTTRGALIFPLTTSSLKWTLGFRSATVTTSSTNLSVQTQPQGPGVTIGGTFVPLQPDPDFAFQNSVVATVDSGSTTVGPTAMATNVTGDGAATVSIPIWVAPGRAGMQPDLSLEYNSRSGDGFLGYGWALKGTSQIARCEKTRARNGRTAPITMNISTTQGTAPDSTDSLCLDGEVLVRQPGSAVTYKTEHDRFALVRMLRETAIPNVADPSKTFFQPETFEVRMKDGRIMTYGGIDSTVEEPIESTLPAHRYAWSLHQVKDRAGNTMTYRYHNDLDTTNHCVQQYISQIDYTGSDTDGVNKALKSVVFIPETREDPRTGFAGGFCWKRDVRFREIQVLGPRPEQATSGAEAPKALLKSYRLTYQGAPTNSRPMLAAVTECDGAGICKPPVQFNYQQGDPDFDEFPINFAPATDLESIQSGDIDGDGTDDLFYWGAGQADGRRIWYQLSNGDTAVSNAFRDPVVPTIKMADGSIIQSANKDFNQEITDPSHRVARGKFRYFDFDMDGRLDFALIHPEQNDVFENMYIFHNDGGDPLTFTQIPGIVYEIPTHFFNPSQGFNLSLQNPPPEFADLNGDGLVDSIRGIITVPDTGESVWDVRLNKGGGFDEFPLPTTDLSPGWNGGRVVANRFINPHSAGMFTRFGHWQSFVYGSAGIVSVIEDETLNSRVVLKQTDLDLTGTAWDYNYWLGDLNNDGLMDIVLPRWIGSAVGTKDPASLAVYMSHGDGKFGTPTVTLLTSAAINGLSDLHSFDYDQDGVADLVAFDTTTQADRDAHRNSDDIAKPGRIYRSSGNGQVSPQGQIKTADGATIVGPQQMLDFDGDGLEDFIGVAYRNVPPLGYSLFRHRGAKANLLTTVTDGLGRRTTFTHKPIRQVSQRSVGCSWPTYCVNSGVWFVSDVDTDSGDPTGRTLHDGYTYLGARSDLGGRGWLGVASRTATRFRMEPNNTPYIVTTTTFDNTTMYGNRSLGRGYDFPFRNVVKSEVTTYKDIGGVQGHEGLLSKVYTLDVVTSASVGLGTVGQSFSVGPVGYTEVLQENTPPPALQRLTSRITESPTQWQYDTHGNRTHEDVLDHLADGTVNRRTTDQTFTQDEGNWLVGQAKTRTVVDQTAAGTSQRTWAFTPDPTTGLLNHVTYQAGVADEQLDVDYVRDSHGMPKTITSSIVSGEKRIKSVVYDDFDGTFPQLVINAKGQPHRTLIHPGLGVDIVDEDANGLRSVGTVDGFGRRRSGKRPDGSGAQIHYEAPAFPMAAYQVRVNGDNGAEARLNFDDWNRVIAREWKDFGTAGFNRVRTTYDADQVFLPGSVTIPSLTPEDPSTPAATFAYDSEGRLLRQTLADGTTDTFVRDNEIQTRVLGPGGRTARLLEDGRGRPMTSAQTIGNSLGQAAHEATTSYTYGLFGQIATVTDAKANVTRIAYDASGRRVSMTDPDTGTSTFTWNGFGDLVQEKDANGQVRTYIPDELGRVRQAITPDGVTAFDWDTAANGVGRIGNTTSPDGVDCTYGYDNFGRQSSQSWTLATGTPGADGTYTMGLSYDSAGRPSTLTYPSVAGQVPIAIRQAYAANGATAGLFRGSNAVWTVNMRDPASRISLETAANGVATSHDYIQATGQVHEIKSVRGAQILRDLLYGYDEAGNVQQRTVDGKVETFGYDTLDRLVSWEQGSSTTNPGTVYSYDDIGNMLARQQRTFTNHAPTGSITDQTTFTPGDGTTRGPHQIASSSLGAFGYDQRGNQTSAPGRTIGFTIFNLPRSITAGTATTTFAYDGGQSRVLKKSGTATIVTLGGMFERRIIGATKTDVFYVAAEGRSVAQISWTENAAGTAVTEQVQYLHDDHVGSVEAITSSTGTVAARQKFDPFGDRIGSAPSGIRVGFQELEQDDEIGLVNMNGRMYDPRQARFVSADPEVQNPFFGQDLNRYAFVRNSPLNYRDPTGFMGESVPQAVDPEEPAPIGGASDRTSVIYTSGGYFGGDSWGNWGPIAGGTPDAFANPPPGPNGGTGPEIVPGNADDNGSRGPQISPSGPPSDSGGGSQTRPAPGWHLLRGQELAGSCVAAACRNAIVLLTGKDVSEAQIRNELQKYSARPIEWDSPGGGGTQIWRAPNVLNDHGLPVQVYRELTSNRIKTTADLVRVVGQGMVMVGGTGRGGGSHVMLLLKTRSDGKGGYQFLVVNSADGEKSGQRISQRWISEQEFGEFYDPDDPKSWIVIQIGFPR